jgi:hypothetical protein
MNTEEKKELESLREEVNRLREEVATERQDKIKAEKVRKKVGSFALPVFFRTFAAHKNKRL